MAQTTNYGKNSILTEENLIKELFWALRVFNDLLRTK